MVGKSTCCVIGLLLCSAVTIHAQELDAAVTWSCQPKDGLLVIRYSASLADAKAEVKKDHPLVFYSLVKLDKDGTTVTGTRSKKLKFQLKNDKIEVTLEPGGPNVNLLGSCGAAITGLLTVTCNGKPLLTEEPFENLDCHERERRIDVVTIRVGADKPEIQYGAYEQ
jgi:hypothetical protein